MDSEPTQDIEGGADSTGRSRDLHALHQILDCLDHLGRYGHPFGPRRCGPLLLSQPHPLDYGLGHLHPWNFIGQKLSVA
jgi:hypothetical protein